MDWDAIGALGEIFGALAVVATLGYLAKQIRQSNLLAQAEAERDFYAAMHEVDGAATLDTTTTALIQKGLQDYLGLAQAEKPIFHNRVSGYIKQADSAYRLNQKGLIPDDLCESMLDLCVGIVVTKGGAQWWEANGRVFSLWDTIETRKLEPREFIPMDHWDVWRASYIDKTSS